MDVVEGRRVELHDAVPDGLLVDATVQGLELSPELHQVTAARACVCLHARRRGEDVPKLDINSERAIRKGGESIIGEKGVKEGFAFA
ncbi:hypothetical protein SMC7_06935 [Candidatus Cryosericum terrychapinii]|uniref:Uncharacterized protein n=1 Tax=Candidatus Cryosericum terrychapinii TaxID=2290919 RepID=A0A398CYC3_9BACT|nr:hypothetical protein SMC7_06935 [Candidatus Cryosericum terrychapinii]